MTAPPRTLRHGTSEPLIRRPLQRRSQESLDRVLQAGIEVLQEEGFEGFTLQEVSRRAGVSIGSIYARVASREALIMAIYEQAMAWTDEQDQIERDAVREDLSPRERIETARHGYRQYMLAHGTSCECSCARRRSIQRSGSAAPKNPRRRLKAFERAILEHREHLGPSRARVGRRHRLPDALLHDCPPHHPRAEVRVPRAVSDKKLVREMARAVADYLL